MVSKVFWGRSVWAFKLDFDIDNLAGFVFQLGKTFPNLLVTLVPYKIHKKSKSTLRTNQVYLFMSNLSNFLLLRPVCWTKALTLLQLKSVTKFITILLCIWSHFLVLLKFDSDVQQTHLWMVCISLGEKIKSNR